MISLMQMLNVQLAVKKDGETYLLDTDRILYIEAVERNTFVCTTVSIVISKLEEKAENKKMQQALHRLQEK